MNAWLLALIGTSVLLTAVGSWLYSHYNGEAPLSVACGYFLAVVAPLGYLFVPFAETSGLPVIVGVCTGLLIGFPCVAIMSIMLAHALGANTLSTVFDSSLVTPLPSDFGRARLKASQGDLQGALLEYRKYFNEDQKTPRALFAAAIYVQNEGEYQLAVTYYREIMTRFERQRPIWAEAALRVADIYQHQLKNPAAGDAILHEIMRHAPHLKQAHLAAGRVLRGKMS